MSGRPVSGCELCGNELRLVLDLGSSPPTCAMAPVPPAGGRRYAECHYPLELLYCDDCGLGQLSTVVDPAEMFPPDYPYQSGNSRALHEDFADLARKATLYANGIDSNDLVVDIGANDGTLLSKFDGCRKVAVEPTGQIDSIEPPVATYREFFDEDVARTIVNEHGQANVVTACNVLAHVEDIDETLRGIAVLLADDGILVAENHDLTSVIDGSQWDTIYHEHIRFWSPYSFWRLLEKHGLGTVGLQSISTHGGSFRAMARKGSSDITPIRPRYDFERLARSVVAVRSELRRTMAPGSYGIGATARATTIINYCGLDVEDIACVCEVAGSDKIGHYIPGTRIPVVDEARLFKDGRPAVLFSWHLANAIVPKLRERGYGGAILIPLPTPRYL